MAGEMENAASSDIRFAAPSWRRLVARFADIVLPPLCLQCRMPIDRHGELCPSCWSRIDFIVAPYCDRLGVPLPYALDGPLISAAAVADPPDYDRARAAACYRGGMRDLVHGLKFRDRHEGLDLFARWLVRTGQDFLGDADLLVPVPLYRLRLWSRRFNQSALLADRVAALTGLSIDPFALARTRATRQQVGLSIAQRRKNVAGAFAVPQSKSSDVRGRHIVLVDDVITTGATANACAKALKRAGAAQIDVLALARVVDPLSASL